MIVLFYLPKEQVFTLKVHSRDIRPNEVKHVKANIQKKMVKNGQTLI